jgi:hypothetical protein
MEELLDFNSTDKDYAVESDFMPVFRSPEVYSFRQTSLLWPDTWILPLQAKDGTFSFLLVDSLSYKTLSPQEHFFMGFSTAKQAIQAAHVYLGHCSNRFLSTFDFNHQNWPPLC